MKIDEKTPRYPIESVDAALKLLLMFRTQSEIGVTPASQFLGVAPSTAHRLLRMLCYHGLVEQDAETRAYLPGRALVEIGLSVVKGMDLRARVRPLLERLAAELDETVHLAVLQDREVMFLDCVECERVLRVGSRVGTTLPAECTAAGKAMLSELPAERLHQLYPDQELRHLTPHSLTTRDELDKDLELTRCRGYAVNNFESEPGVRTVAVAVPGEAKPWRAAITIAAPSDRLPEERIGIVAAVLRQALAELSA